MQPVTPCETCANVCGEHLFRHDDASRFKQFHENIVLNVVHDQFAIEEGDVQWQDEIRCLLRCVACGRRFCLDVETFHGSGGAWRELI
jgi:hypothetical protein